MGNTRIIFAKEFRTYFDSAIPYIVLLVLLGACGWFFAAGLFLGGQANILGFLNIAPLVLIVVIPAITMRLLAEEERLGTIEILATMPLEHRHIILGKYLAALAVIAIGIACSLVYPISVHFLGNLDWGEVIASYIGLLLMAAALTAIGVFGSALSRSQIVSFVIAFIISFVLFILGKILNVVPSHILPVIEFMSLDYHFMNMTRGVIDTRDVLYFLSLAFFFLSLTYYFFRRSKLKAYSSVTVVVILLILIVINLFSERIFRRLDLTEGHIYRLSRPSVELIRDLDDPVLIKAYLSKGLQFPYSVASRYVSDLLLEYRAQSRGRVRVELIDPSTPETQREAQQSGIQPLTITEVRSDKYETRLGFMGIVIMFEDRMETLPFVQDPGGLEYDITSKIKKISATEKHKLAFSTGHEEIDPHDLGPAYDVLEDQYDISIINPSEEDIPEDIKLLVIAGPRSDFGEEGLQGIDSFITNGGKAMLLIDRLDLDPTTFTATPVSSDLDTLLNAYGIEVEPGIVMDHQNQTITVQTQQGYFTMRNMLPFPPFPRSSEDDLSRENPMVKELESLVFPIVSPLNITREDGIDTIALSSPHSWYRQNIRSLNPFEKFFPLPTDSTHPYLLACVLHGTVESPFQEEQVTLPTRMLIVGTSKLIQENFASLSNITFFQNAIDWLMEDERLITIRSKGVANRPLKELSTGKRQFTKTLIRFLPPVLLVVGGIVRHRTRRRKRYEI